MTLPAESLPAIMQRTLANLETMHVLREKRALAGFDVDYEGPYEVTQLVNSFLGALAHPWEALFKEQDLKESADLGALAAHLAHAKTISGQPLPLNQALGYMRNAFAHGNLEFLPNPTPNHRGMDIGGIRLWNCQPVKTPKGQPQQYRKNWEIELSVDQLRQILKDFSSVAQERYKPDLVDRSDDCNRKEV